MTHVNDKETLLGQLIVKFQNTNNKENILSNHRIGVEIGGEEYIVKKQQPDWHLTFDQQYWIQRKSEE